MEEYKRKLKEKIEEARENMVTTFGCNAEQYYQGVYDGLIKAEDLLRKTWKKPEIKKVENKIIKHKEEILKIF